jgi:hypothetical protein
MQRNHWRISFRIYAERKWRFLSLFQAWNDDKNNGTKLNKLMFLIRKFVVGNGTRVLKTSSFRFLSLTRGVRGDFL